MKKKAMRGVFYAPLYVVMALVVSGCASSAAPANNPAQPGGFVPVSSPASADGLSLDQGIARIAADLEAGLPENTRIAVVNFESPSARFSDYVLEELQGLLVNRKRLTVSDRSNLELRRNELNFQLSRGVAYKDKGEHDKAVADYTQALRLDPNYAAAYINRGIAYSYKEDYARARADWEKALQLDPNNAGVRGILEALREMGH
jgi:tetratricopeptide (TPR) repeat protein